jgi:hypothetical protein
VGLSSLNMAIEKADYVEQRRHAIRRDRKPLLLCLGSLAVVYWLWTAGLLDASRYTTQSYALCSPKGAKRIYTVDDDNSLAECLLVKGERFVETGSLGVYICSYASIPAYRMLEQVRSKTSDVRLLPEGATVVPGMTGKYALLILIEDIKHCSIRLACTCTFIRSSQAIASWWHG